MSCQISCKVSSKERFTMGLAIILAAILHGTMSIVHTQSKPETTSGILNPTKFLIFCPVPSKIWNWGCVCYTYVYTYAGEKFWHLNYCRHPLSNWPNPTILMTSWPDSQSWTQAIKYMDENNSSISYHGVVTAITDNSFCLCDWWALITTVRVGEYLSLIVTDMACCKGAYVSTIELLVIPLHCPQRIKKSTKQLFSHFWRFLSLYTFSVLVIRLKML